MKTAKNNFRLFDLHLLTDIHWDKHYEKFRIVAGIITIVDANLNISMSIRRFILASTQ